MEKKNPFEGMGANTTPKDLLRAVIQQAVEEKKLEPFGSALIMIQQQLETIAMQLGKVLEQTRNEVGQIGMMGDVSRLTSALIINILIDGGVITKEEFEKSYKEKVSDVMEKHLDDLKKKQEEMVQEEQRKIEEFTKKAMEMGKDEAMNPETGEVIQLHPVEDEDTEEEQEVEEAVSEETEEVNE